MENVLSVAVENMLSKMDLTAHPEAPLPCYGLEHDVKNAQCAACPHAVNCAVAMGDREGRVPLHRLQFRLTPSLLRSTAPSVTVEQSDFGSTYAVCHQQVFGSVSSENPSRYSALAAKYARRSGCDLRLYVLACMMGHALAHPDARFYAAFLADGRALSRAKTYVGICAERYGGMSDAAIGMVTGTRVAAFELNSRMRKSEAAAGKWIIQYKLKYGGSAVEPLLAALETSLDPNWLAIEPAYCASTLTLAPDEESRTPSSVKKHRHAVREAHARMKRNRAQAVGNFRARERAFPGVILSVLEEFGYAPDDFEAPDVPVEDTLQFWSRLGQAVQHFECMKYLDGKRCACVSSADAVTEPKADGATVHFRSLLPP